MVTCSSCAAGLPEGARFCPSCAAPVGAGVPGTQTSAPTQPTGTPPVSRPGVDDARFLPGTMLANRYRLIGRIGQGGMGDVFRADDLKLGQPVALKFLPHGLERDVDRQTRFLNEVKLARQVSHPNVCRVYDVGETDGQQFLSMEYVDGEDLSSLLKRIGRFPQDKAIQMARELCAGLAAAHEQGILHRDLKPANVLIDSRGRPKITDFGLAGMAETFEGVEVRAGTPAYQAPEQRTGESVSVRSDIYSLALVLYELCTGKPAFEAANAAELGRLQSQTTPTSPSSHVDGFDPVVERVLLRCLDPDPAKRPGSATGVAAALPGGDPLAAALAAGETPSPELVAAAGESIEVPRWLPWSCLALAAIGIPFVLMLAQRANLFNQVALAESPELLQARAQQTIRELGYEDPPLNRSHYFAYDDDFLRYYETDPTVEKWNAAFSSEASPILYVYRQGPDPLVRRDLTSFRPDWSSPPWTVAGMTGVRLDSLGRLVEFRREPTAEDVFPAIAGELDWRPLFEKARLDPGDFTVVAPAEVPAMYADEVVAWEGTARIFPEATVRVLAAAAGGKPVLFRVSAPEGDGAAAAANQPGVGVVFVFLLPALFLGAGVMAARNLRQDRVDRRGARRLAFFMGSIFILWWMLGAEHASFQDGLPRFMARVAFALLVSGILWILYLAVEPVVRRRWPDLLVSWTRILDGRWRDPLVGRDLVIGVACAVALAAFDLIYVVAPSWTGGAVQYQRLSLTPLLGGRMAVEGLMAFQVTVFLLLLTLLVLVLSRVVQRRTWVAFLAAISFQCLVFVANTVNVGANIVFLVLFAVALVSVLMRFGLLAAATGTYLHAPLSHGLTTANIQAWYADYTVAAIVLIAAIGIYGFVISFGGRSIIGENAFEDV